jgi:hypothetical protein
MARPAQSFCTVARQYAILGALAASSPAHVVDLKVPEAVETIQYLPCWTPAQMLQEYRE